MAQGQLNNRYTIALQALASLEESIDLMQKYAQHGPEDPEYRSHRDSVIKRFELSLDTFWKHLKFFLEETKGIVQNSPKPIMRECYRNTILTQEEGTIALAMIDARNLTSHIYREEIAEQIIHQIPVYYKLMKKILERTKPEINPGL